MVYPARATLTADFEMPFTSNTRNWTTFVFNSKSPTVMNHYWFTCLGQHL
jgi:hypothetical protein